jgi:hypothetical protein
MLHKFHEWRRSSFPFRSGPSSTRGCNGGAYSNALWRRPKGAARLCNVTSLEALLFADFEIGGANMLANSARNVAI